MITNSASRCLIATIAAALPLAAMADPVQLRTKDGLTDVEGEITAFDGTLITLETRVGEVRIPAALVQCFGDACPDGIDRGVEETRLQLAFDRDRTRDVFLDILRASSEADDTDYTIDFPSSTELVFAAATSSRQANVTILYGEPGPADPVVSVSTAALNTTTGGVGHHLMALRPYVITVAPDVGVSAISTEDLAKIYAGELTNWAELGGADQAIQPIRPAPDLEEHADLTALVLDPFGLEMGARVLTVQDEVRAAQMMGRVPGSIAVVSAGNVSEDALQLDILNACDAPAVPAAGAVSTGAYPLTLASYANITPSQDAAILGDLFDLPIKNGAQAILSNAGFSDLSLQMANPDKKSARVAHIMTAQLTPAQGQEALALISLMLDASQIDVDLFVDPVNPEIDAFNRAHFARLADALDKGQFDGQEIIFLGFNTDAPDPAGVTAEDLLTAFQAFAQGAIARSDVTLSAMEFGNLPSLDCVAFGTAPQDKHVEVWVRPLSDG